MNLITINNSFRYETENLLRLFYPHIKIYEDKEDLEAEELCVTQLDGNNISVIFKKDGFAEKRTSTLSFEDKKFSESDDSFFERKIALMLFDILCEYTGYTPPWGILTGVRPAKLMTNLAKKHGEKEAVKYFIDELKVSKEKTALALKVAEMEAPVIESSSPDSFSLYVAIPFCPSRCTYCSFVSHSNDSAKKLIPQYVDKVCEELIYTAEIAKRLSLKLESVYIGGGTPTVLTAEQLNKITNTIKENYDFSLLKEYTIEAGRPDSTDEAKLEVMKNSGCTRISINPQTFNDNVLNAIGRKHTSEETENCFNLAREKDFSNINMDLIAGLPEDTVESFEYSLSKAISMNPENITVHTLALKRSSNLVTDKKESSTGDVASKMLSMVQSKLTEAGYIPYYMYRQSKCLGNLENVGWAKEGYEGLYNVYMMEECHTVLAVGAGAVTKLKAPLSGEIERIFNYKYPYEYIDDFEQILNRKNHIEEFYGKFISEVN